MGVDSGWGETIDVVIADISIPWGTPVCSGGSVAVREPREGPEVLGFPCFSSSHLLHLNSEGPEARHIEGHEHPGKSLNSEVPIPLRPTARNCSGRKFISLGMAGSQQVICVFGARGTHQRADLTLETHYCAHRHRLCYICCNKKPSKPQRLCATTGLFLTYESPVQMQPLSRTAVLPVVA